jgi:hypothetical protein
MPDVSFTHRINQKLAQQAPSADPAATCGHVWWPNQTLDRTIMHVHGKTTIGVSTAERGKVGWMGN